MDQLELVDGKYRYTDEYEQRFNFSPKELSKFEVWDRLLEEYNKLLRPTEHPSPLPEYSKEEWRRFQDWRLWRLSQRHPSLFEEFFEPIDSRGSK